MEASGRMVVCMDSPMKVLPANFGYDPVALSENLQELLLQNYECYVGSPNCQKEQFIDTLPIPPFPSVPGVPEVSEVPASKWEKLQPTPVESADARPGCTPYPSQGSIGHPTMCRRPCVYLAGSRGPCPSGLDCSYCHFQHNERRVALDKRQREFLRRLNESDAILVVLPHLKATCAKQKLPPAATDVLKLLEARLGDSVSPDHVAELKRAGPRNLQRVLAAMSFACLANFLPCSKDDDLREALEQLRLDYAKDQLAGWAADSLPQEVGP
mmetsp:Transcript_18720/g.35130  ORF Transcript_18720/g.35130 Transcript_18720/m.35130 type:complete len:270 (+) Transcript_18720:66-875(+)